MLVKCTVAAGFAGHVFLNRQFVFYSGISGNDYSDDTDEVSTDYQGCVAC
jgi:hypothetical protein